MPRWEYRKLDLNDLPRNTDAIDLLNDAGRRTRKNGCSHGEGIRVY